jgi:NTE family protein
LLRNNRGSLRAIPRTTLLAGLAPAGRGKMVGVERLIQAFVPAGEWTSHPGYRAVALDYETGRRVVFGAADAPPAGLSDAVLASCAIPGWFEPVTIGGRRYVDGGMWSATNVDLLAGAGLDEIFVLAPMASAAYDAPGDWRSRVERRLRVASTRRCLAEARKVQLEGTTVTILGPGPEDLQLMGYNLMAPERRRVVLESAVRTGMAAFMDPPVVAPLRADQSVTGIPMTGIPNQTSLDRPLIARDLDVNRSDHG